MKSKEKERHEMSTQHKKYQITTDLHVLVIIKCSFQTKQRKHTKKKSYVVSFHIPFLLVCLILETRQRCNKTSIKGTTKCKNVFFSNNIVRTTSLNTLDGEWASER